jgi:hypothetical protein
VVFVVQHEAEVVRTVEVTSFVVVTVCVTVVVIVFLDAVAAGAADAALIIWDGSVV